MKHRVTAKVAFHRKDDWPEPTSQDEFEKCHPKKFSKSGKRNTKATISLNGILVFLLYTRQCNLFSYFLLILYVFANKLNIFF